MDLPGKQPGATRSARELRALISAREFRLSAAAAGGISPLQEWSRRGLCQTVRRAIVVVPSSSVSTHSRCSVSSWICFMLLHFPFHRNDAMRHSSVSRIDMRLTDVGWFYFLRAIFSLRLLSVAERYFFCLFPSPLRQLSVR